MAFTNLQEDLIAFKKEFSTIREEHMRLIRPGVAEALAELDEEKPSIEQMFAVAKCFGTPHMKPGIEFVCQQEKLITAMEEMNRLRLLESPHALDYFKILYEAKRKEPHDLLQAITNLLSDGFEDTPNNLEALMRLDGASFRAIVEYRETDPERTALNIFNQALAAKKTWSRKNDFFPPADDASAKESLPADILSNSVYGAGGS
ncbi:MAG: hypothetical protein JJT82_08685 [Legionellaceae bacterium]|nr:hypothetical protein [Legionellaceae bacterium]